MTPAVFPAMVDGVVFGALIVLIALGHLCVRLLIELVDFAHGRVFLVGAYGGLATCAPLLPTFLQYDWYVALPLLLAAGALVAVLVAAVMGPSTVAPLDATVRLPLLLLVLVVSVVLYEAIRWLSPGADEEWAFPEMLHTTAWEFVVAGATVDLRWPGVLVTVLCLALSCTLYVLVERPDGSGVRLPAVPVMTPFDLGHRSAGDHLAVTAVLWFACTTGIVGLAGILYGVDPTVVAVHAGHPIGLWTAAAAVLGWTGRVTLAVAGGTALGLAAALGGADPPGGAAFVVVCAAVLVAALVLAGRTSAPGAGPR